MKIGPSQNEPLRVDGPAAERSAGVRNTPAPSAGAPATGVDRVSLSGAAPSLNASTPFDEKKVEAIRRAIQEGRFPVDARKVADSLLADVRDLLGAGTSPKP